MDPTFLFTKQSSPVLSKPCNTNSLNPSLKWTFPAPSVILAAMEETRADHQAADSACWPRG